MAGHIAVIDPGTRVPELDTFNRMALRSQLPLTYHLAAQHGLDSLHRVADGVLAVIVLHVRLECRMQSLHGRLVVLQVRQNNSLDVVRLCPGLTSVLRAL